MSRLPSCECLLRMVPCRMLTCARPALLGFELVSGILSCKGKRRLLVLRFYTTNVKLLVRLSLVVSLSKIHSLSETLI